MFSSTRSAGGSSRPLPLKQRTSSLDTRRDYSHNTWWSTLVLLKVREYLVTVDNFSIWRRHLAWAMENGKDLRAYMTQRYGSSMVFMSLLLSTELSILFNSAPVTTKVREALREGRHESISFWAGFLIMISALLTVLSLIALFTAWGMVNSIDENNAHCIFRSSIGQYAAELPGRLIVCSIYSFLISFMLFFFLLLPVGSWSIILSGLTVTLFLHIVSTFSAFGRVIMHTGAMGKTRIFSPEFEEFLLPHSLHIHLLAKARANLANSTSIIRQYRRRQQPIDRHLTDETLYDHLSGNTPGLTIPENIAYRPRADSTVRFADVEQQANSNNDNANFNGGGNNKSNNFSSYHQHSRTLTPLSDSSSFRVHDLLDERPTPTSSLRKSSFGAPPRPRPSQEAYRQTAQQKPSVGVPPPPTPPPSGFVSTPSGSSTRSMDNVSTRSLEEWLSNSGRSTAMKPVPAAVASSSNGRPNSIASATAATTWGSTSISDGRLDQARPAPLSVGHRSNNVSLSARHDNNDPKESSNAGGNRQSSSPANNMNHVPRLSPIPGRDQLTPVHSELSFDDRDLSEDERFTMDYGDIEEADTPPLDELGLEYQVVEPSALRRPSSSGQTSFPQQSYNDDRQEGEEDTTTTTTTDGELRGLLDHYDPQFYSGTLYSDTSGDGTTSTTTRQRGPSPPTPPRPPKEDL